jgi:opacity protein-like surface antigen
MTYGLGFGYQFNSWLRADVTGEYRGGTEFHGLDIVSVGGVINGTDEYRAVKSEWLFMANAYADLGTWWCFTPFVGAGVGFTRTTFSNFLDVNTANNGVAFAPDASKYSLAWALHAGVGYQVNRNVTVELAYRYLDLGDGRSGDIQTFTGINNVNNPMEFRGLTSHDIKLGVRFQCCEDTPPPPPPPLMRKG